MNISTSKFSIARSICAMALASITILSSVFTVAAAVQSAVNPENNADKISSDGIIEENHAFEILNSNESYHVLTAYEVTIVNGDNTVKAVANGETVAEVLDAANIVLDENQVTVPAQNTVITCDTVVTIYDGIYAKVTADGKTQNVLLATGDIREALNAAGFEVGDDDIVSTSKDNTEVVIQRVTYKTEATVEKIAYDSVRENSDEVELGETKVKTEGKNGEMSVTTTYKYIDGEVADSEVVDTKIIKEPVDEVVLVGTKGAATSGAAGTFTDSNGTVVGYTQVLTGSGTAYTAPAGACTATGVTAYHGGVAVNPNIIPYGSKLYIESTDGSFVYGYATAVDTGGALMSGTAIVDCFYNTYDECVNFGRRNVNVYVLG